MRISEEVSNRDMADPPSPRAIYEKATDEGRRRLAMPALEKAATAFIAGVTIVFGIVALAVVYAIVEEALGRGLAELAGAAAFAIGVVFLVIGRTELFTENFFGPVAAVVDDRSAFTSGSLASLWLVTLVLNLIGGAIFALLLTVEGGLPDGAPEALVTAAEEVAGKAVLATLVRAIAAGALLTLLSYMLHACDSAIARIALAYIVGFFVAIGPFDHVVVSALHLLFGVWFDAAVGYADVATNLALSTAGNLAGGLLLITLTHTAQVKARAS